MISTKNKYNKVLAQDPNEPTSHSPHDQQLARHGFVENAKDREKHAEVLAKAVRGSLGF